MAMFSGRSLNVIVLFSTAAPVTLMVTVRKLLPVYGAHPVIANQYSSKT
jgi:hypothetical protein